MTEVTFANSDMGKPLNNVVANSNTINVDNTLTLNFNATWRYMFPVDLDSNS